MFRALSLRTLAESAHPRFGLRRIRSSRAQEQFFVLRAHRASQNPKSVGFADAFNTRTGHAQPKDSGCAFAATRLIRVLATYAGVVFLILAVKLSLARLKAVPAATNTRLAPAYSLCSNDLPPTAALTPLAPAHPVSVVCPRFPLRRKARAFASKHARSIRARSRSASTVDSSYAFRSGDPPKRVSTGTCHSLAAGHGAKRTTHGAFAPPQHLLLHPIRSTATSSPPPSTCVSSFPPSLPAPSFLSSDFAHPAPVSSLLLRIFRPTSVHAFFPPWRFFSIPRSIGLITPRSRFIALATTRSTFLAHRTSTSILATVVSERHVPGALLAPAEVVSFVSADSGRRAGTLSRCVAGRTDAAPDASWWMAASVTPRRVRALRQHGQERGA
ncbi:hypothetical protein B0H10DRAFT_2241386 [Mycena sp. CBHHK59/15]|nr:hypothetical protein B0H10DRAFT_2241386 [Mycena sp. CBHHK59/15]